MSKKLSINDLELMLANAKVREVCGTDVMVRMDAREEVKRLKNRIAARLRDEARRDCGLVKTPYGWE